MGIGTRKKNDEIRYLSCGMRSIKTQNQRSEKKRNTHTQTTMSYTKISQKTVKIVEADRKAIIKLLDLDTELASKIEDLEMPTLGKGKTGGKNKDGFPRKVPGYMLFCNSYRDEVRDSDGKLENPKEVMSNAAAQWKTMEEEGKKGWLEKAEKAYEEAKSEFMSENPDYETKSKKTVSKKKGDSKKTEKESKVKVPRATSAFQFFLAEYRGENTEQKGKAVMEGAGEAWKEVEDKSSYEEEALKTKLEAEKFRAFAKSIKEDLISEGVEETTKALREAAAKKWWSRKEEESGEEKESEEEEEESDSENE